jgi:hypothetical protein
MERRMAAVQIGRLEAGLDGDCLGLGAGDYGEDIWERVEDGE